MTKVLEGYGTREAETRQFWIVESSSSTLYTRNAIELTSLLEKYCERVRRYLRAVPYIAMFVSDMAEDCEISKF